MKRRTLRSLLALCAIAAAALAAPAIALAHAGGTITYDFPLPVWVYAVGGGLAVLASVPAAMLATPKPDWTSRDIYPVIRPLRLGAIGTALGAAMLLVAIAGGLFGPDSFTGNPATIVFWVDVWVGVGISAALLGNLWDFTSPLSACARWIDRRLSGHEVAGAAYPERLGMWPAVLLLLGLAWLELCWPSGSEPQIITLFVVAYIAFQLFFAALFGAEVWLARGELFTAVARTLSRMAPLEPYVRHPAGACPAGICAESDRERIGCVACWRAAAPHERGARLRFPGAGIHRESPLPAGGSAFVVALLATVVFDGFGRTDRYFELLDWILEIGPSSLAGHSTMLRTVAMIVVIGGFAALYVAVSALIGLSERRSAITAAGRYAATLIPIAGVYFVAHYLAYLIIYAQFTPAVLADPLGRDWIHHYGVWSSLPAGLVWWVQVALIVAGHVIAVFQAHRIAAADRPGELRTLLLHSPLTLLMIGYTVVGLWVLGQAAKG
ncbi:MAG: hypothetical protein QOF68_693 [Gaiellales bacterium]|nr:hypothetical protein [Gaiellales bacterium]